MARALSVRALAETPFSLARTRELHGEARDLFVQLGDNTGIAKETVNLGNVALVEEDYSAAAALSEEGCELYRALGRRDGVGTALVNLAIARYFLEEVDGATAASWQALEAYRELDDEDGVSVCLEVLAAVGASFGRASESATILGATERQRADTGYMLEAAEGRLREVTLALVADLLAPHEIQEALESGRALTIREAVEYVHAEWRAGSPATRRASD
jgi:hypothetical protein